MRIKFREIEAFQKKKKIILFLLIMIVVVLVGVFYFQSFKPSFNVHVILSDGEFKTDTVFLKSGIKYGESVSNNLRITNSKSSEQNFEVSVKNLEDLVFLSEDSFKIAPNGVKDLEIMFRDNSLNISTGVYVGLLVIRAGNEEREIPIILEIEDKWDLFATNLEVSPEYKEVEPGEKFSVNVKLFNLNDTKMHIVEMSYFIKDFEGEIIFLENEEVIVGTEVSITKIISLPEDIAVGNYAFIAITEYADSLSTSSYLFNVAKKKGILPDVGVDYFIILIFVFLFAILGLIGYIFHDRNKLILELKKQHVNELKISSGKIEEEKKKILSVVRAPVKRKEIKKEFKKLKKKVIRKIKERHKEQKREFKELKKHKKKSEMKQKLEKWRKEGFNVNELLVKNEPIKKNIDKQMSQWKKEGFDTSVLKK